MLVEKFKANPQLLALHEFAFYSLQLLLQLCQHVCVQNIANFGAVQFNAFYFSINIHILFLSWRFLQLFDKQLWAIFTRDIEQTHLVYPSA